MKTTYKTSNGWSKKKSKNSLNLKKEKYQKYTNS